MLCHIAVNNCDEVVTIEASELHILDDNGKAFHADIDKGVSNMYIIDRPRAVLSSIIYLLAIKAEEYLRTV